MTQILPFSLIIFFLTMAFAWSGHWLFGDRVLDFQDIIRTSQYLLLAMVEGIEYQPLKDASPIFAPAWFFSFLGLTSYILLNVFIAILGQSYEAISDRQEKQKR